MNRQTVRLENGSEIAYLERAGGSQPLVLLHGITDNADTYLPVLNGIHADSHVLALDFRGHGESTRGPGVYDTAAYAEDVAAFIDQVVGQPVVLA